MQEVTIDTSPSANRLKSSNTGTLTAANRDFAVESADEQFIKPKYDNAVDEATHGTDR